MSEDLETRLDRSLHRAARKRLDAVVAEWSQYAPKCIVPRPVYLRVGYHGWGRGWYVNTDDRGWIYWGRTVEDALASPWAKSLENWK